MNDRDRMITGTDFIEMYDSLHQAISNAGGSGASFTPDKLKTLTVMGLFNELATNGVRFYCNKTHACVIRSTDKNYEDMKNKS